jgi:DNA repair protein RecN (Recombination protein N)
VLEEEVADQLDGLAMPGARIQFNLRPASALGPLGADDLELQIATNRGDSLRGLERVASGGERSRLLLALKRVLAEANEVPIAIFDEIDAGVGGRVSEAVGRKLLELSQSGQVFTITHLAPIAAMGHRHHVVTKDLRSGRATTCVGEVEGEHRLGEIARMLGGSTESQGANDHARELLQQNLSRHG